MANEYGRIIEEMVARCELLHEGQSREECCIEKGIINCPTTVRVEQDPQYQFVTLGIVLLIIFTLLYLAIRKKWPQRIWSHFGETTRAVLSGWAIWFIVVLSYILIMQPYSSWPIHADEYLNLAMWLTLPPLATFTIHLWVRRFVRGKK